MEEIDSHCPVCYDEFSASSSIPHALPCFHHVCAECVKKLINDNTRVCPVCRAKFVKDLGPDRNLIKFLNQLKMIKKASLSETKPTTATRDSALLQECKQHKERLKYYCYSHKQTICRDCRDFGSCKQCKEIDLLDNVLEHQRTSISTDVLKYVDAEQAKLNKLEISAASVSRTASQIAEEATFLLSRMDPVMIELGDSRMKLDEVKKKLNMLNQENAEVFLAQCSDLRDRMAASNKEFSSVNVQQLILHSHNLRSYIEKIDELLNTLSKQAKGDFSEPSERFAPVSPGPTLSFGGLGGEDLKSVEPSIASMVARLGGRTPSTDAAILEDPFSHLPASTRPIGHDRTPSSFSIASRVSAPASNQSVRSVHSSPVDALSSRNVFSVDLPIIESENPFDSFGSNSSRENRRTPSVNPPNPAASNPQPALNRSEDVLGLGSMFASTPTHQERKASSEVKEINLFDF